MSVLLRRYYQLCENTNPYSVQATAALNAQFPTQWPTIRDYGFAHPALVPFINEDPMLVCSLMELGKIRILRENGMRYDTDVYGLPATIMKAKFLYASSSVSFGCRTNASTYTDALYFAYQPTWGNVRCRLINGSDVENGLTLPVGWNEVEIRPYTAIVNGTSYSIGRNTGISVPLRIGGTGATGMAGSNGFSEVTFDNVSDNKPHKYVPFRHEGVARFLDVYQLVMPTKVGTNDGIIELIETPAT